MVYNLVLFYFVAQIVLALAIGNLSVGSCVSSKWCIFVVVVLVLFFGFVLCFFFKHFLSLQDTTGWSCVFPAPVLESAVSPRNPCSLYLRRALETNSWVFCVGVPTGGCCCFYLAVAAVYMYVAAVYVHISINISIEVFWYHTWPAFVFLLALFYLAYLFFYFVFIFVLLM